jgi:GNAT superfamily N-acetyltransferase
MKLEPKGTIECRELTPAEMASAVREVIRDCPEIPYFAKKDPEIFIPRWMEFMRVGIARSYGAFCGTKPIGLMLGIVMDDLLSPTRQAQEVVWQVNPAYRSTGVGPKLMNLFEASAREAGCYRVVFGASTEWEYEKMLRLYRKLGYTPISMGVAKNL